MSNAIPDDHHTVTTDTGTTIGHTWPGTWAPPYTAADDRDTAWFARSVHDDAADTFLHEFSTQAQAEDFLRARDTIARRAARETDLLAHPEHRTCGYRETLVHLESDLDQPIPALFTYATGPRFTPDAAEIVVALLNRAYLADHERPLAYYDGSTITVVYPNCYADDPAYCCAALKMPTKQAFTMPMKFGDCGPVRRRGACVRRQGAGSAAAKSGYRAEDRGWSGFRCGCRQRGARDGAGGSAR